MTTMKWNFLFVLSLFVAASGCGGGYSVEVKNSTTHPVTLWLYKDGPPAEDGWYAPEELGRMPEDARPGYDLAIVPPGKTGYTPKLEGKFPSGTRAMLRVYDGQMELFHILEAEKLGQASRADVPLNPGNNKLTVTEDAGKLVVER